MVKPFLTDRPKKVTITLPESVFNQVHLLLLDPVRARTKYGALSSLATSLFRNWLEKQRKEASDDRIPGAIAGSERESPSGRGRSIGRVSDGVDGLATKTPNRSANEEDEEALNIA